MWSAPNLGSMMLLTDNRQTDAAKNITLTGKGNKDSC